MKNQEASSAVINAIFWIGILSWMAIIVGTILLIIGICIEAEPIGLIVIGSGIGGLIMRSVIKGFEAIVEASEIYIEQNQGNTTH